MTQNPANSTPTWLVRWRMTAMARVVFCLFSSCFVLPVSAQDENPVAAESAPTNAETQAVSEAAGQQTGEAPPEPAASSEALPKVEASGDSNSKSDQAQAKADDTVEEIPFKVRPYTVRIEVGFQGRHQGTNEDEEQLLADIRNAVSLMYGDVWTVDLDRTAWLIPSTQDRLRRLEVAQLSEDYPEQKSQKVFFVTVESRGAGFRISCREFDAKIQELTPVYEKSTLDGRTISTVAARLMRDAFRPNVLFLRNVPNDEGRALMELQVQAGAISPPDPSAEQVVEGDVLRTFTRQMDRRDPTKVKMLRAYPLSYVRILSVLREKDAEWTPQSEIQTGEVVVPLNEEKVASDAANTAGDDRPKVSRGLLSGIFLTHMRMSLFGAKGRRMQHLGVRQRPTADESRVRIVLQGRPDRPLVSHRLAIAYQLFWKDEEDGPQTPLVTDRNGEVVVQMRENHPTFWMRVYSGTSLLARVPYAPGLLPYDVVELPDDSVRLGVEGEINLLADELIDAIALREVLIARANSSAKAGDGTQVQELLDSYEEVPGKTIFLEKISNIRVSATKTATEKRLGTRGIRQLCDGLESTVKRFFSDEKRIQRQAEIEQLKRAIP